MGDEYTFSSAYLCRRLVSGWVLCNAGGFPGRHARSAFQTLDPERPLASSLHVHRRADQCEVRERLREVAQQLPAAHVHLLGEQPERRAEVEQALEASLR